MLAALDFVGERQFGGDMRARSSSVIYRNRGEMGTALGLKSYMQYQPNANLMLNLQWYRQFVKSNY